MNTALALPPTPAPPALTPSAGPPAPQAAPPAAPGFKVTLEHQMPDPRGSQVLCTLRFENTGDTRIKVFPLRQLIPDGAWAQQVSDTALSAEAAAHARLCADLSRLLNQALLNSSEEFRTGLANRLRDALRAATSNWNPADIVIKLMSGQLAGTVKHHAEGDRAWALQVRNAETAQRLDHEILAPIEQQHAQLCRVYRAKMTELIEVEKTLDRQDGVGTLADIGPGGSFSRTFIFNCHRRWASPKTYTFVFEGSFAEDTGGPAPPRLFSESFAATISPKPMMLSIVAMASAVLGAVLKIALDAAGPGLVGPSLPLPTELWALVTMRNIGLVVAATITALFFFNIYDATDVGKKVSLGIGWRSALVIGGLSGLMTERVVAALKGLIG